MFYVGFMPDKVFALYGRRGQDLSTPFVFKFSKSVSARIIFSIKIGSVPTRGAPRIPYFDFFIHVPEGYPMFSNPPESRRTYPSLP